MIDSELLALIPPEAQEEYVELDRLFESDVWIRFVMPRLTEAVEAARARKEHAETWEDNRIAHGEVRALTATLELPAAIEAEIASVVEPEESEDADFR